MTGILILGIVVLGLAARTGTALGLSDLLDSSLTDSDNNTPYGGPGSPTFFPPILQAITTLLLRILGTVIVALPQHLTLVRETEFVTAELDRHERRL